MFTANASDLTFATPTLSFRHVWGVTKMKK